MSRSFLDISFRPPEETDAVDFATPAKQPNNSNSQLKPASNGPLSPFSPILQRLRRKPDPIDDESSEKDEQSSSAAQDSTTLSQQQQQQQQQKQQQDAIAHRTKEHFLMSLTPCRKVSVVVCVDNDGAEKKRKKKRDVCLFPLQSQTNTAAAAAAAATHPSSCRDIVVVNPKAFGTVIPSSITMETSRVVAQIANIPSEDWTRTYRFQHVVWDPQHDQTLLHLCQAAVHDINANNSIARRIFLCMGQARKTQTLFGHVSIKEESSTRDTNKKRLPIPSATTNTFLTESQVLQQYGLLGWTVQKLLEKRKSTTCLTLSVLEVADEHTLYDLLSTRPFTTDPDNKVTLRYSDGTTTGGITSSSNSSINTGNGTSSTTGALLEGLSNTPIDSLKSLGHSLRRAFAAAHHPKRKASRGTLVLSLQLWHPHTTRTPRRRKIMTKFTSIQFVDVGCLENDQMPGYFRRNAALRKSEWALGGVLRGTLLQQAGTDAVIPYRESALTRVLQRPMECPDSRTVVLASVDPTAYQESMTVLRYVSRLIHKTGQTPQSPYIGTGLTALEDSFLGEASTGNIPNGTSRQPSTMSEGPLQAATGGGAFLQNMVADPRQRLAKLVPQQKVSGVNTSTESDGNGSQYQPTQYTAPSFEESPERTAGIQTAPPEPNDVLSQIPSTDEVSYEDEYIPTQYMEVDPASIMERQNEEIVYDLGDEEQEDDEEKEEKPVRGDETPVETNEQLSAQDTPTSPRPTVTESAVPTPQMENTQRRKHFPSRADPPGALTLDVMNVDLGEPSPLTVETLEPRSHWSDSPAARNTTEGSFLQNLSPIHSPEDATEKTPRLEERQSPTQKEMDDLSYELFEKQQSHSAEQVDTSDEDIVLMDQEISTGDVASEKQEPEIASPSDKQLDALDMAMEQIKVQVSSNRALESSLSPIEHLRRKQETLRSKVGTLTQERDELREELETMSRQFQRELGDHEDEIDTLYKKLKKSQHDKGEVVKIAEEAISTQAELEKQVTQMEGEIAAQTSKLAQKDEDDWNRKEYDDLKTEFQALQSEVEVYKKEITKNDATISLLERQLNQAATEKSQIQIENSRYHNEIDELKKQIDEDDRSVSDLADSEKRLRLFRIDMQTAASESERREAELRGELKSKTDAVSRLEREAALLTQEIALTKDSNHSSEEGHRNEISRLRAQLSSGLPPQEQDLLKELNQTRDELDQRLSDVQVLSAGLEKVLSEKEKTESMLQQMEAKFKAFETQTQAAIQKIRASRIEEKQLFENALADNAASAKVVDELTVRHRRDQVLMEQLERENFGLRAVLAEQRSHGDYRATRFLPEEVPHPDLGRTEDYNAGGTISSRASKLASPLKYGFHGSSDVSTRAEEVAAYMAVTAKDSMERSHADARRGNAEILRLAQEMQSMGDAKEAEVIALRRQNQLLQRRLDETSSVTSGFPH